MKRPLSLLASLTCLSALFLAAPACSDDPSDSGSTGGGGGEAGSSSGGSTSSGGREGSGGEGTAGSPAGGSDNLGGQGGDDGQEPEPTCVPRDPSLAYWVSQRMVHPPVEVGGLSAGYEEIRGLHARRQGPLSATWASDGPVGDACIFANGATMYLSPPNEESLPLTTVEFWFRTSSADVPLISAESQGYMLSLTAGQLELRVGEADPETTLPPVLLSSFAHVADGKDHFVAVVHRLEDDNSLSLYLDGALVGAEEAPPVFFGETAPGWGLQLGGAYFTQDASWFGGYIDDVSLYTSALTEEQIAELYAAGSAGKCRDAD